MKTIWLKSMKFWHKKRQLMLFKEKLISDHSVDTSMRKSLKDFFKRDWWLCNLPLSLILLEPLDPLNQPLHTSLLCFNRSNQPFNVPSQHIWKFTRVLQHIGSLGPLPCSHSTSWLDHSQQGIRYRWPCEIHGWLVLICLQLSFP